MPGDGVVLSHYLPRGAPWPLVVVVRAGESFIGHEMPTYAAALAYRGLLALFPFIILIVALVNSLDMWRLFEMLLDWARKTPHGRVPSAIKEWMVLQARERAHGVVLSVGALAGVWAVASGARVLRRALNVAGAIPEVHPAWVRLALSLVAAPVLGSALLAAVALFTLTRAFLLRMAAWFHVNEVVISAWDWLRIPAGVAVAGLVIVLVYRFAPSTRQPVRALMPGGIVAALVWAAASLIFSRVVSGILDIGVTYGSFSAGILLLTYLYLGAAGLLFGAELNAAVAAHRQQQSHVTAPPGADTVLSRSRSDGGGTPVSQ